MKKVREDMKPIPSPSLPKISEMTKNDAKIAIEKFLVEFESVIEKNHKRNKKALKYCILCGIRKGFLMSCGRKNVKCASWCPRPYWEIDKSGNYIKQ